MCKSTCNHEWPIPNIPLIHGEQYERTCKLCDYTEIFTYEQKQNCNHSWVYDINILTSFPPKQKRICRHCGMKEIIDQLGVLDVNQGLTYGDVEKIFEKHFSEEEHAKHEYSGLDIELKSVTEKSWVFGNSGFGLVYEAEPNEYYLLDLVDGKAEEGEAVNVFKFPKSKGLEVELAGIQEWFSIFIHGFSYVLTKQSRQAQSDIFVGIDPAHNDTCQYCGKYYNECLCEETNICNKCDSCNKPFTACECNIDKGLQDTLNIIKKATDILRQPEKCVVNKDNVCCDCKACSYR